MKKMRKIVHVKANDDFSVICRMENGEVFKYDMSYLKNKSGTMIMPLKEPYFFSLVGLDEYGNLSWPNGYDISANTVEEKGILIQKVA